MPFDRTPHKRAKQIANLDRAEKLWRERVPPDQVDPDLYWWDCGTHACFGGWMERLGMIGNYGKRGIQWGEIHEKFGAFDICFARNNNPDDREFTGSDYDLVLHRIKCQRERLLADS